MTDLPTGWAWATLGEVAATSLGKMLDQKQATGMHPTPYLRNINVRWGTFDLTDVAEMDIRPDELDRVLARPGDVVACEGGEPGRAAVWRGPGPIALQKALHRIRPREAVSSSYLALLLQYLALSRNLETLFTGTTIKHLPQEKLRLVPVPTPPRAEQDRIVAAIEEHLSRLDAAEGMIQAATRRINLLRTRLLDSLWNARGPYVSLGQLLSEPLANGRSVPSDERGFPVLRLTAVRERRIRLDQRKGGAWDEASAHPFLIARGDFLVSRGSGSLALVGRGGLVEVDPDPVAYPDTLIRVRVLPGEYSARFLSLVWDSRGVRRQIERLARTTAGIYKINQPILQQITLPKPSLAEQIRLADLTEEALARLLQLNNDADVAQARSETLGASILAAAFAGTLVPQDPADEPASELLDRIRRERVATSGRKRRVGAS